MARLMAQLAHRVRILNWHKSSGRPIREIEQGENEMELNQMTMTDGYVGSMGKTWKTPTQADLEKAITCAMEIEDKTREQIIAILESGKSVKWCESPNFFYDHSYGVIGTKLSARPVKMVVCDCGHSVPGTMYERQPGDVLPRLL